MIRRSKIKLVYRAVKRSGIDKMVENVLVPVKNGRRRQIKADVMITAAVLVAMEGKPMTMTNIHKLLTDEIPPSTQRALMIRAKSVNGKPGEAITIRQVRYFFEALEKRLEYTPEQAADLDDAERELRQGRFQDVIDGLLAASIPDTMARPTAFALDSSGVESWAKSKFRATATHDEVDVIGDAAVVDEGDEKDEGRGDEKAKKRVRRSRDLDARVGYRTKTYDNKSDKFFGFDLYAFVGVLPAGADPDLAPKLLRSLTLRPAGQGLIEASIEQLRRLAAAGYDIVELLVDRGFSYRVAEDWASVLRALGINQVQDIHPNDHGSRPHEGMRLVDGVPHCPSMPDKLAKLQRPRSLNVPKLDDDATPEERANHARRRVEITQFQADIKEREKYAFVWNQDAPPTARDQGKSQWQCPAQAGKLRCDNCPLSVHYSGDVAKVENPPELATAPKCCTQKYVTVPGAAMDKLRQEDYWGSPSWWASYARRTHVEGMFGNLRNPDTQNIKRGFCRVYGLVKTSLMLTFEAMAANIRLLRKWSKRTGDVTDPLCEPYPEYYGHEEVDENGQAVYDDASDYEDPPGDPST
jgi:hypothetical protein